MVSVYNRLVIKGIHFTAFAIWMTQINSCRLRRVERGARGMFANHERCFSVCKPALKALYLTTTCIPAYPYHTRTQKKERKKRCLHIHLCRENSPSLSLHGAEVVFHSCSSHGGSRPQLHLRQSETRCTKPHTRFVNTPKDHQVTLESRAHTGRHTRKNFGGKKPPHVAV